MRVVKQNLLAGVALALLCSIAASPASAQLTSSAVRGIVTGANGAPVDGATVTITHVPTGSTTTATTSNNGAFLATGLRVGGPYRITVTAQGFGEESIQQNFFNAGQTANVTVDLDALSQVEEVVITGEGFSQTPLTQGVGSAFNNTDILNQPSFSRELGSLLASDPLANVTIGSSGVIVNIAGSNARMNGFAIDGVLQDDDFGISASLYATARSPLSLDTVESANIVATDYTVMTTGFQGGLVNVVTKSGTNEFRGSVYGYRSGGSFFGDVTNGTYVNPGDFKEDEYGFTLGGPIVRDRAWFFGGYENYESARPSTFTDTNFTPEIFDTINDLILSNYGFDAGGRPSSFNSPVTSERTLVKGDLNITDDHRLTLSYQRTRESQQSTSAGSFQSAWYEIPNMLDSYSAQLFSSWSPNFDTEFRAAYKTLDKGQICNAGTGIGEIQFIVDKADLDPNNPLYDLLLSNGDRTFIGGCDRFRHGNAFADERRTFYGRGTYQWGEHAVTFGAEYDSYDLNNLFISDSRGTFVFDGYDALISGTARVDYRNVISNNTSDAGAIWGYNKLSLFLQDEWVVTPELTVNAGVRYETYLVSDKPPFRQDFLDAYNRSNQVTLDGRDIWEPRVGFRYQPLNDTVITGGFGLFAGGDPVVWTSNAYSPQIFFATGTFNNVDPTVIPQALLDSVANSDPTTPTFIDVISPDFKVPSQWKASVRWQQYFDADIGNLFSLGDDYVFTAQYLYQKTRYGYTWQNLAQLDLGLPTGVAPDGRPIYSNLDTLAVNNAVELQNTTGGRGHVITVGLAKAFESGLSFNVNYSWQDITGVTPGTSSRGVSNFRGIFDSDRNNPSVGRADFETKHKFGLNFAYERDFWMDLTSRLDVFGIVTSGKPFSYVFDVSNNNPLFGRSGNGEGPSDTDLLYVPQMSAGTFNDPRVVFLPAFNQTAFANYIEAKGIPTGGIVPRHFDESNWSQRWDLRFQQELPFWTFLGDVFNDHRLKFVLDIENLPNLLNSDWGTNFDGPANDGAALIVSDIVSATDVQNNGVSNATALTGNAPATTCVTQSSCLYRFRSFTDRPNSIADRADSVYKIRIGLRYEF